MPGPSTIRVGRAETAADWRLARRLLGEHRRALTVLLGVGVLLTGQHVDPEQDGQRAPVLVEQPAGEPPVGRGLGPADPDRGRTRHRQPARW